MIRQLSIFLENKVGMLSKFFGVMSRCGYVAKGISVADTTDFGILRVIVEDPEKAVKEFRDNGYSASVTNVVGVCLKDDVKLDEIFSAITEANISIEYLYTLMREEMTIVMKVSDSLKAENILKEKGLNPVSEEEIWG